MHVLAQHGEWTSRSGDAGAGAIAGWELHDEVDMELGPDEGYEEVQRILAGLPADGRLRYSNYGKGVMFWETDAQAAKFINDFQDIVSVDTYWFTDLNICGASEGGGFFGGKQVPAALVPPAVELRHDR